MLDLLLAAPKDKRRAMTKRLNAETRKRIFDNIYTMTEELELGDVPDFETRVKMRHELIQRFPDMVFWDYAECANFRSPIRKKDAPDFERYTCCKVSTRGDVVIVGKQSLSVYPGGPNGNYLMLYFNLTPRIRHRVLASTFILRPDAIKHIDYRELHVNHIDSVRGNDVLDNLEWVTTKQNTRHGFRFDRYDETKYFLFRVLADNGFMGREFILDEHNLHLVGTDFTEIRSEMRQGVKGRYKGIAVSMLHHEDIGDTFLGLPPDIAELFNKDIRYFDIRIKPVIGTVVDGRYRGFEFSFFGGNEISQYFHPAAVCNMVNNKGHNHLGCIFRYGTHAEAIPLHGRITKEIADDARKSSERYICRHRKSKDP